MQTVLDAQARLSELNAEIEGARAAVLQSLESGQPLAVADAHEGRLAELVAEASDAATILRHFERLGEAQRAGDVLRVLFQAEVSEGLSLDALSAAVLRWADACPASSVSGLVVRAETIVFGIVEGPDAAAEALVQRMQRDGRLLQMQILQRLRISARQYPIGLRLVCSTDAVLATVLSKCRAAIALGLRFAPAGAVEMAQRGGAPSACAPAWLRGQPLLCVAMGHATGVVYSPAVYRETALQVEEAARRHGGVVIERFGEHMIVLFPHRGPTPGSTLFEAANEILRSDHAAGMLAIALHIGDVHMLNAPHCVAVGEGLAEVKRLVDLAEVCRRPLLATPAVAETVNKALHKPHRFSHNTVAYYTLPRFAEARHAAGAETLIVEAPPGMKSIVDEVASIIRFEPQTIAEVIAANAAGGPLQSEHQVAEARAFFRRLDALGSGWITKAKFRQFLLSNEAFVVFPHDAPKVDQWIAAASSLGPERISFEEFLVIYLRLNQM